MRTDRVVVITGAAGGMGSVLVERFLDNGDRVVATDVAQDALAQLADRHAGARLHTTPGDVSDENSCAELADLTRRTAGRVDVLVHTAGYFPAVPFDQMTTEQWRQVIDINLTGSFLVVRAVLPLMKGRGWGRIVLYGSASIFEGNAGQVHYVAAKAGVVGLTRSLAMALGGDGITVNCIAPGLTLTPPVRENLPPSSSPASRAGGLPRPAGRRPDRPHPVPRLTGLRLPVRPDRCRGRRQGQGVTRSPLPAASAGLRSGRP